MILSRKKNLPGRQTGFTLVELMVGMVIGLLATMVIMQMFTSFEAQKRTTTGNADAQTNGSIALYSIQREVMLAGYGLPVFDTVNPPMKCTSAGIDISPLTITDGGGAAGASDSINLRYGNSEMGGSSAKVTGVTGLVVGVDRNFACSAGQTGQNNGDTVFISGNSGTSCAFNQVTGPTDIERPPVPSTPPDGTHIVLKGPLPLPAWLTAGSSISCVGNTGGGAGLNLTVFSITNNQLMRAGVPIQFDIVNMQAQYGVASSANSNVVTDWVDASGAWASPLTVTNRNMIKAIRVAVVARNGEMEKTDVTAVCTTAKGTVNNGPCAWDDSTVVGLAPMNGAAPKIDLSNDPDWKRYRYRVFETIIPLRNVIWTKGNL